MHQGYIVIPISKNAWESEATFFSDFSRFLPLKVYSDLYWTNKEINWEFHNAKFTLRNLIVLSSLLDRGLAEFVFPNTTFVNFFRRNMSLLQTKP